jgi:hypothetical protein
MALGDALGAHVEFRPREFLVQHPVEDLEGGGTWGLNKGEVTLLSMTSFHFILLAFITLQNKTQN